VNLSASETLARLHCLRAAATVVGRRHFRSWLGTAALAAATRHVCISELITVNFLHFVSLKYKISHYPDLRMIALRFTETKSYMEPFSRSIKFPLIF
jgi:hypothetical protein